MQTGGHDTNNGGGFDTGVSGFPTDGAATSATGTAPVFSSASYSFVAGDAGHWIYVKSGTNWTPGWYQIASVSGGAATLNAAVGAAVLDNNKIPNATAGCATTASPTGATWGIDYSQGTTPFITFTDMVIGGTTTQFTSAGNPVAKNFVGNVISVTSGTGFTVQRVAVVSTSGTTATCDKSLGTGGSTGGNGGMGGALASLGLAGSVVIAGNWTFVKTGSYTIASATINIATGCYSSTASAYIMGYGSVRGDLGTAPVLTASGISTATIVTNTGPASITANVTVDGATLTAIRGVSIGGIGYKIWTKNCTNKGIVFPNATPNYLVACRASGCTTTGPAIETRQTNLVGCQADGNSVVGYAASVSRNCYAFCIASGNTGASTYGFNDDALFVNCVAYGNGSDGFRVVSTTTGFVNCIAEGNGGYGVNLLGAVTLLLKVATYNNTSGAVNSSSTPPTSAPYQVVSGSGSFFTNAASGDFSLNATAGAGALARAAGFPGAFPDGLTTGYLDIGAAQHADPQSGGFSGGVFGG